MSGECSFFNFCLRGRDSLVSKWISQKRKIPETLKTDGANIYAISEYIHTVFYFDKLYGSDYSCNVLFNKIIAINELDKNHIVKFDEIIKIPFDFTPYEFTERSFDDMAKDVSGAEFSAVTLGSVLSDSEIKELLINIYHINYDLRENENIKNKTYDEIISGRFIEFKDKASLSFFIPYIFEISAQKVAESSKATVEVPLATSSIQPELSNTTVEGYFYKRATGQADSKNNTYKGTSRKVYSVEEFKTSYTTSDCIDLNCEYDDFRYICDVVMKECATKDLNEYKAVAFASKNRSSTTKQTWRSLLASGYSSVQGKTYLLDSTKTAQANLARRAVIYVLEGHDDITDGAEFWDGTDFIAWGLETTPQGVQKHAKFRQYKFIEISSSIYNSYKSNYSSSIRYSEAGHTSTMTHTSTETHIHKDGKIRYNIPAEVFKDNLTATGDFQYDTDVSTAYGLTATLSAGESIFWKLSKTKTLINR